MKDLTKFNENIWRLQIPYKDIYTTVYTIKTPEGVLLFDAASFDEDIENYIIPMLKETKVTAEDLKYVFISHNHIDHSGGLRSFMKEFPNTCILSRSERIKNDYEGYNILSPDDNDVFLNVLKFVAIPGHSRDSAGILDTRTNTLISGDSLQLHGIIGSGDWACNITLVPEHLEALEKVHSLEIDEIITAHDYYPYGFRYSGKEEISKAIDACIAPLVHIKDIILENPAADDDEIREIHNAKANLPTVKKGVVTAVREAMKAGKI